MGLPYYKRFPRDFLEGTIGLSFEAKGAYAIVLDLIYMRDGRLPDDARYIAGQLGCSVRKWTSLLSDLVAAGKSFNKLREGSYAAKGKVPGGPASPATMSPELYARHQALLNRSAA